MTTHSSSTTDTRRHKVTGDVHLLLVATGERGLAGAFNSAIARMARDDARKLLAEGKTVKIFVIGRKGYDILRRQYAANIVEHVTFRSVKQISFAEAKQVAEASAENERLVKAVFEELSRVRPKGFRYATMRQDDGVSFVHVANYDEGAGSPVNLYVAYYHSQRKGEAVHSPRSCMPGGGWQLRDFDQRTLMNVTIDGRPLRVNRTLIELGTQRQLVYYWFQQRGRDITNEFAVKWYLFWDALTRHRTDGALVRLIVALPTTGNEAEADRRLSDLARRLAPTLTRYVPD